MGELSKFFETPIELTASIGSVSTVSIDSYCNLATKPIVYMIIANTPANVPRPTIITNRIAQYYQASSHLARILIVR